MANDTDTMGVSVLIHSLQSNHLISADRSIVTKIDQIHYATHLNNLKILPAIETHDKTNKTQGKTSETQIACVKNRKLKFLQRTRLTL